MSDHKRKIMIGCRLIVTTVERLSATIVKVTFKLDRQQPIDTSSLGLGPHLKLIFPTETIPEIVFPPNDPDGKMMWPEGGRPPVRTYSLRHYDAALNQLVVEFAVHAGGIGSAWAQHAKPGDIIGLLGMGAKQPYQGQYLVLVGDISAKPAVSYILENLPEDAQGIALIEVPDASDRVVIKAPAGIDITWLVTPQEADSQLPAQLDKIDLTGKTDVLIWGGLEGQIARQLRRELKDRYPFDRDSLQLVNYWLEGHAEGQFKRRED